MTKTLIGTKVYLGDAVYAEYIGTAIKLTTLDWDTNIEHTIILDDTVLDGLEHFKQMIIKGLNNHYVESAVLGDENENT